ncbi:clathrin coat assembly protein AP180 [Ziziphus jujuba]|uniref:Clathrin coat assembly protein AP180 n=2 Tax=Ziziphus jujuba TaxID=326968 RepID=A0A6P4A001_ZIZJJ|nr:clathrin coat assembly protein AP180 [Ziziphus jujuba]KAH7533120.1 hypothetical protein FEM48_Zijuj04G0096700 [Ziziphus jujuba var. spinosa]
MPSKLRKAIGAVKDQTSISLAKVASNNAVNLEVTILKATSHDAVPIDDRYVNEILQLIASNKTYAAACAQSIGKRIGKTKNWIVALKSLMLVLRIFQDGDPYFPREVLHAMKRGSKILNLANFRDDSNSSPWDYTAFVRTFALYLDERLDCFLTGKLQRRFTHKEKEKKKQKNQRENEPVTDMKPAMLLDRLSYWQKLLDRAIATKPTGTAKTNRLILISLYAIIQETFDLYRDISDGLALLLDSFFHLQYQSCVNAFQACVRASKQFEELSGFFNLCKSLGVGRTSEYPSVQKISDELIETLQEFLKDQASFPGRSPTQSPLPALTPKDFGSTSEKGEGYEISETVSEACSRCTSLEDLMSATGTSPSRSVEEIYSEKLEKQQEIEPDLTVAGGDDSKSEMETAFPVDQSRNSDFDFLSFDEWPIPDQEQKEEKGKETTTGMEEDVARNGWELVLVETALQPETSIRFQSGFPENLFDQSFMAQSQYNPFLQDSVDTPGVSTVIPASSSSVANSNGLGGFFGNDWFAFSFTPQSSSPSFSAQNSKEISMEPTFSAQSHNAFTQNSSETTTKTSPFSAQNSMEVKNTVPDFFSHNSTETRTTVPDFFSQNSSEATTTMAPTFFAQDSRETTAKAPSFFAENETTTVEPTFFAQNSKETTTMASSFFAQNETSTSTTTPTFVGQNSGESKAMSVTLFGENHNEISSAAPKFSSAQSSNEASIAPTFCAWNPKEMTASASASPTFYAQNPMKTTTTTTMGLFNENDPFRESFPVTHEQMYSGSGNNQQSLVHQQQLWLENQTKIIAKHMGS